MIEAMACEVPIVGSDSGEIPFVVEDAGVVRPEADAAAWANALGELLENPCRREVLGAAGLARVRDASAAGAGGDGTA